MNWKRWKIGIIVAFLLALLVAGSGVEHGSTWTSFLKVFCSAAGALFGAFLKDHPIDNIDFGNGSGQGKDKTP